MWVAQSEAGEGDQGTAWYLTVNTLVPETPDSLVVAPEVVAAAGMHEAALEQTRSVLRNLNGKLASGTGILSELRHIFAGVGRTSVA